MHSYKPIDIGSHKKYIKKSFAKTTTALRLPNIFAQIYTHVHNTDIYKDTLKHIHTETSHAYT